MTKRMIFSFLAKLGGGALFSCNIYNVRLVGHELETKSKTFLHHAGDDVTRVRNASWCSTVIGSRIGRVSPAVGETLEGCFDRTLHALHVSAGREAIDRTNKQL